MLENVSWTEYFATAGAAMGGYYLLVGGLFFRKEIKLLVQKGTAGIGRKKPEAALAATEQEEEDAFERLNELIDELRDVMEQAGQQVSKPELLDRLKDALTNYDGLRRPAYHAAINDFIIDQGKELCGVVISETELETAWRSLPR